MTPYFWKRKVLVMNKELKQLITLFGLDRTNPSDGDLPEHLSPLIRNRWCVPGHCR